MPALRPASRGRVDDVVDDPDPELEQGHREPDPDGQIGASAGDERDGAADEAVEDRRERVAEAEPAEEPRSDPPRAAGAGQT